MQLREVTKMSELFELVLDDAHKLDRDVYMADSSVWHDPGKKRCSVCLAGMSMAQFSDRSKRVIPIDFSHEELEMFRTIEKLRCENWEFAIINFRRGKGLENSHFPFFERDIEEKFKNFMLKEIGDRGLLAGCVRGSFGNWEEFDTYVFWVRNKLLPVLRKAEKELNLYESAI